LPSRVWTDQPNSPLLQRKQVLSEHEYDVQVDNGYNSGSSIPQIDPKYNGVDIQEEGVQFGGLQSATLYPIVMAFLMLKIQSFWNNYQQSYKYKYKYKVHNKQIFQFWNKQKLLRIDIILHE
jgi:hypothetical protein